MIRALKVQDFDRYCELLSQLNGVIPKVSTNTFEEILSTPHQLIMGYYSPELIATGKILFERKIYSDDTWVGHVEDVVVDSNYRSTGVGRMLIEYLVKAAKERKCYKVILSCSDKNIGFYEKCGLLRKGNEMATYFS